MDRGALMLLSLALLGGCSHPARRQAPPDEPPLEGGVRIRMVAEVPAVGTTSNGTELDLPLAWIHLIADPVPTGGAPNAAVGARVPCGYEPYYAASDNRGDDVRLRVRARRLPSDAVDGACRGPHETVHVISLGLLRLGTWNVVDAVPHVPTDPPSPSAVEHVVPDDAEHLPPPLAAWTRGCSADADCTAGGVCVQVGAARVCLAPRDPWRSQGLPCPDGTIETDVGEGAATRRACMGQCSANHGCPNGYACNPANVCLPVPRADVPTDSGGRRPG